MKTKQTRSAEDGTRKDDFPYTVAISKTELIALVKFHTGQARAIPKRMGKLMMEMQATSLLGSPRKMKELHDVAREQLDSHTRRARGLLSILQS